MTTTLLTLDERLLQSMGDWKQELATTYLSNTSKYIISTHLNKYTSQDDYFNDWWAYIEDKLNIGVSRKVSDYVAANTTLTVLAAANFLLDTEYATFRLSRSDYDTRKRAINEAIRETYPTLHRRVDNRTLSTGNILPNAHFEDWAVNTYPDKYTVTNCAVTANTVAGYYRGGAKSAKVVASATNGYMSISSDSFPRLLDLMDKEIDFKAWALPQAANNTRLAVYVKKADGTTATQDATTANPAGLFTLLKIEDYAVPDDIVEIQFRFPVLTNTQYGFFDAARVTGRDIYEYLLPKDFQNGSISEVYIQTHGYSDEKCDDLQPREWAKIYDWKIITHGTEKYLVLPAGQFSENLQIRLIGTAPLESLSASSDTISLDDPEVNLLIAFAKYKLYQATEGIPASEDIGRYERGSAKAYAEYMRLLPNLKMAMPSRTLNLPSY